MGMTERKGGHGEERRAGRCLPVSFGVLCASWTGLDSGVCTDVVFCAECALRTVRCACADDETGDALEQRRDDTPAALKKRLEGCVRIHALRDVCGGAIVRMYVSVMRSDAHAVACPLSSQSVSPHSS